MLIALSTVCTEAIGQANIDSLYSYIMNADAYNGTGRLETFENTVLQSADDSTWCDFLYIKGCFFEKNKDIKEAVRWYRLHALKSDSLQRYVPSFFDSVLKVMLWDKDNNLNDEAVALGLSALRTPASNQAEYPYQYLLYSTLATLMNMTSKYADVPEIATKGMFFVRQRLSRENDEYFQLPIDEAVAWSLMGHTEKADSICQWIEQQAVSMSSTLRMTLRELRLNIQWCKEHSTKDIKQKALRVIDKLQQKLLTTNAKSKGGSELFHDYFDLVRNTLTNYYYDVSDKGDETVWSRLLANQMLLFYICCDSLPQRTHESYDNAITRKDFLSYHTGKLRKKPMRWQDVQRSLKAGDAAIEICSLPEEVLVLRKECQSPKSIPVDSLLFEEIVAGLKDEPLVINELYAKDGPLARFWKLVEPELKGINALYISGSNEFSQINYGAIALDDGSIVADKYNCHTLLSTTDAGLMSEDKAAFRNAVVFGGIDYENAKYDKRSSTYNDEDWQLTRGLPDSIRGGFGNLPGSRIETICTDSILKSNHIPHYLYIGGLATEESFKSLNGNAPNLLHLSTHGFMLAPLFNSNDTAIIDTTTTKYKTVLSQSGLLFAGANKSWRDFKHGDYNDGILTSREITHLDLSGCKLAVLTACRSALGETRNLTGVPFGVAYALKLAGVKQVLCSLWSIKDDATATFMKKFYEYLFNVNNAREALRMTQQDMMRSREYSSPYYWASFVIVE